MRQAAGFPCPCKGELQKGLPNDHIAHVEACGYDQLAEIMSDDIVHIVELKCYRCRFRWAIEGNYPSNTFSGPGHLIP